MHAQILAKTSPADALAFMREFLAAYPDAREVRLAYARSLVSANQLAEARVEFTRLSRDYPAQCRSQPGGGPAGAANGRCRCGT